MLRESNPPVDRHEQYGACLETYSALQRPFKGELLRPGDPGYEDARSIWNGMVARTPGLIARCVDVSDIRGAIRAAVDTRVVTAVRCGGHSLAGFSTCDNGLVIDLSRMRDVSVDPRARRARVAGGCLLGSIDGATQKAGLVFPSGVVSHTGAAGLILGGGTGWLTRRFGLSCDNVEAFTIVTADGSILRADAKENADLYWALRGGGGNFGVVIEFELKLYPLKSVVLAEGLTPEDNIRKLLECWRDFMVDAPFDLKWNLDLRLAPYKERVPPELRGRRVAASSLIWTGAPQEAKRYFKRAFSLCHPDSVCSQTVSLLHLQTMADSDFPHGQRYYTKSGYFRYIDDGTIDCFLAALSTIPSPGIQIELTYLGGAAGQVAAHETAFGDRSAPFITNLLASWQDVNADAMHISWIRLLFQKLRPAMTPGVYVNFMSGDEEDRVPEAYQHRWERMVAVKTQYDPNNFFRLNHNVQPNNKA